MIGPKKLVYGLDLGLVIDLSKLLESGVVNTLM